VIQRSTCSADCEGRTVDDEGVNAETAGLGHGRVAKDKQIIHF
jgi:hypothetical protein